MVDPFLVISNVVVPAVPRLVSIKNGRYVLLTLKAYGALKDTRLDDVIAVDSSENANWKDKGFTTPCKVNAAPDAPIDVPDPLFPMFTAPALVFILTVAAVKPIVPVEFPIVVEEVPLVFTFVVPEIVLVDPESVRVPVPFPMLVAAVPVTFTFVAPRTVFVDPVSARAPVVFPMLVAAVPVVLIFVVPRTVFVDPVSARAPVVFPILVAAVPVVFMFVVPRTV
jgi:hypothetical protein